ncbi:MAG: hypothetical protein ACXV4Z_07010 [Halobacteriota archaeon]
MKVRRRPSIPKMAAVMEHIKQKIAAHRKSLRAIISAPEEQWNRRLSND